MSILLELIFQGFIEWIYGMILECWEKFSTVLLDLMNMDFAYLRTRMPVIDPIMETLLAVGWALLLGNLVFQAAKTMLSGLGFEGEDPKLLFTRTFVFAFLLLASPQICKLCLNLTSEVIELLELPDAVDIKFADEASFMGMNTAWLLVVICGVITMFQSFKLIFEMAERYFIVAVLTMTAPLAFGMGGSKNTSAIFSGWCRMYGSMCLLMVMNVIFVKLLLSVLSFYPSGFDVLPWMVLVLTVVKVAKKTDAIITRIGLNPAITGDSLGRTFPAGLSYIIIRTASSQIAKTIGKNAGDADRGGAGFTPPGGPNGPSDSGPYTGAEAHAGSSPRQRTVASNKQEMSRRGVDVYVDEEAFMFGEQPAGTSGINSQYPFVGATKQTSRKSAVPPGIQRSPSYVKPGTAGTRGTSEILPPTGTNTARKEATPSAPRTARESAPTRFSHVSGEETERQTYTECVGRSIGSVSGSAVSKSPGTAGMALPAVPGQTSIGETRYSRNPGGTSMQVSTTSDAGQSVPERQEPRPVSAPAVSPASGSSPVMHPGTARAMPHLDTERSSIRESRHGRNPSTVLPMQGQGTSHQSPVRQEPAPDGKPALPMISGQRPDSRPGMAGTAPEQSRASVPPQTAERQQLRAKLSAPTKQTPIIKTSGGKKTETRKTVPKPPGSNGGTKHG